MSGISGQISVFSSVYTVTSTGTTNVPGTLLYGINQLDSTGGSSSLIDFDIPGSGVHTISPASPGLPTITARVTIEGTASGGVPQIQILAGSGTAGLTFGSGSSGSSVQDLVIGGFSSGQGIDITSSSTNDSVIGCWLGINASGSAVSNRTGIFVGGSGATIGATTTGDANIISGNTNYGVVVRRALPGRGQRNWDECRRQCRRFVRICSIPVCRHRCW